jgi:hypothetical protein
LWECLTHLCREHVHFTFYCTELWNESEQALVSFISHFMCTDWACMPEWVPSSCICAFSEMETQSYCIICWLLKKYAVFMTTIPWGPSLRSYNHEKMSARAITF